MRERRGSVLSRWFVSYLAILLIPLLFSALVYSYSLRIINQSSGEIYESSLEQLRIEVDNFVSNTFQALQQLAVNSDIQALTLARGKLEPRNHWNVVQARKALGYVQNVFPLIDDIFVVLNPLDSAFNTSAYMTLDIFHSLYYESEKESREEFKARMMNPKGNEIYLVNDRILMLQPGVEGFLDNAFATIAIACRKDRFVSRFLNTYEANGCRIFIVSHDSRFILGSGNDTEVPFFSGSRGIINGEAYRVLSLESSVMKSRYLYYIPENLERGKARQIQAFTFAGLFICSLFGLFLSLWLTKRHYDPVRKLMAVFKRQEKTGEVFSWKGEDEFRWMERRALDTQSALGNNLKALRKYFIRSLLEKPFDPVHGKREMERYRIRLEGEWNLAAVFVFPGFPALGKVLSENEGEIISALQFVLMNIFGEDTDREFTAEMTDAGEHVAAIINWSGDRAAFISRLEDKIEYTQQEAGNFLHFPVLTALGEPRRGLEGIYYSYLEAMETLGYLDTKTGQTILHYHDIKHFDDRYQFTQETEQKLINLVRSGDSETTCGLLRQIWAENNNTQNVPGRMSRFLVYDILGSLIKGMEQGLQPEDFLPQGFNPENIPPGELIGILENAAVKICRANFTLRQSKPERQLSERIKKYIEENYKNPDINISLTGFHFNMNPAYLSAVFKEETGIGLLEYINTLRIEEAKKLLRSGTEVNEAAEQCGFRGSGYFIRVFKKLTGVTPGMYRELEQI